MKRKLMYFFAVVLVVCSINLTAVILAAGADSGIGMTQGEWTENVTQTETGVEIAGPTVLKTSLNAENIFMSMNLASLKGSGSYVFSFSADPDGGDGLAEDGTAKKNVFGFRIEYDSESAAALTYAYKLAGESVITEVGNEITVNVGSAFNVRMSLIGCEPVFYFEQDATTVSMGRSDYPKLSNLAAEMFADKDGQTFMRVGVAGEGVLQITEIATDPVRPQKVSGIGNVQDNWAGNKVVVQDGVVTITEATGIDAALLGTPIQADGYTVSLDITHAPNGGFNMISFADAWGVIPFGAFCDPTGFNTSHTLVLYWDVTPSESVSHAIALKVGYREKDSAVPGQNNIKNTLTTLGTGCTWEANKPFTLSVTFAKTNPVVTISQDGKSYSQVISALTSDLFMNDSGYTYISVSNSGTAMNINNISTEKISVPKVYDNGFDKEYKLENDPTGTDGRYDYYLSTPIYAEERGFSFDMQVANATGGWDIFTFANVPDIIPFGYVADPTFNAVDAFTVMYYAAENRFEVYFKEKGAVVQQLDALVAQIGGTDLIDNSKAFSVKVSFAGQFAELNIVQESRAASMIFDGKNGLPAIESRLLMDGNGFTFMNVSAEFGNHQLTLSNLNNLPELSISAQAESGEYGLSYTLPEIQFIQANAWGYETEISVTDPEGQPITTENNSFVPEMLGNYVLNVKATDYWGYTYEKNFNIEIKDTTKPVIDVEWNINTVEALQEIELPVGLAADNYDESVSVQIKVTDPNGQEVVVTENKFTPEKAGEYQVNYTAADSNGNNAEAKTFTITVTKPADAEISFTGGKASTLEVGTAQRIELPEAVANAQAVRVESVKVFMILPGESEAVQVEADVAYTFAKVGVFKVYCIAEDVWGNEFTSPSIEITVTDTTSPVITVDGVPQSGKVGQEIELPAGQAADNYDETVAVQITVIDPDDEETVLTGYTFTPEKAGSYTVVYSAADAQGNNAEDKIFTIAVQTEEDDNNDGNVDEDNTSGGNNDENTDNDGDAVSGGCSSSVSESVYLFAAAVMAGVCIVLLRKRMSEK